MTKANGRGRGWRREPPERRFLRFADKSGGAAACWPWTGSKAPNGYGQFDKIIAHRFSWTLVHGDIPEGLCICHRCDNRGCVNPAHLFLDTQQNNIRDCVSKGRHGTRTHPAKFARGGWRELTVDQVKTIRTDSRSYRALAAVFGVAPETISNIKRRLTWKFVP